MSNFEECDREQLAIDLQTLLERSRQERIKSALRDLAVGLLIPFFLILILLWFASL